MEKHYLYRITYGNSLCAGIVATVYGRIIATAPVLNWMWGKYVPQVARWVTTKKGGTIERVATLEEEEA